MARIMVVDDVAFMRTMLKDMLVEAGQDVVAEAANGEEAVRMYKKVKPDLVTMDITMPDKDGIAALKEIRLIDPAAKIIMCSAMEEQNMVIDSIRYGARDFLVKPLDKDGVQAAVLKLVGEFTSFAPTTS